MASPFAELTPGEFPGEDQYAAIKRAGERAQAGLGVDPGSSSAFGQLGTFAPMGLGAAMNPKLEAGAMSPEAAAQTWAALKKLIGIGEGSVPKAIGPGMSIAVKDPAAMVTLAGKPGTLLRGGSEAVESLAKEGMPRRAWEALQQSPHTVKLQRAEGWPTGPGEMEGMFLPENADPLATGGGTALVNTPRAAVEEAMHAALKVAGKYRADPKGMALRPNVLKAYQEKNLNPRGEILPQMAADMPWAAQPETGEQAQSVLEFLEQTWPNVKPPLIGGTFDPRARGAQAARQALLGTIER